MRIVIAGGHGQIALALTRLAAARGDDVVGLVRNPDHVADVRAAGGAAALVDLESAEVGQVAEVVGGADVVVFAAGAGPGSTEGRKDSVDRAASALLADAAEAAGVRRYLQISAMSLDRADDPGTDPVFAAYLRAKDAAERDLRGRDLEWTIVRPGRLTDDEPSGRVALAESLPGGSVSRGDVAAVLLELAHTPRPRVTVELTSGLDTVPDAVQSLPNTRSV